MVAVDTTVWSLFLRRRRGGRSPAVERLKQCLRDERVVLLGVVYQELLSGVKSEEQYQALSDTLSGFPLVLAGREDHEAAANCFSSCRKKGVQGSSIDFLICAMAMRRGMAILTTDKDFARYKRHLPIELETW